MLKVGDSYCPARVRGRNLANTFQEAASFLEDASARTTRHQPVPRQPSFPLRCASFVNRQSSRKLEASWKMHQPAQLAIRHRRTAIFFSSLRSVRQPPTFQEARSFLEGVSARTTRHQPVPRQPSFPLGRASFVNRQPSWKVHQPAQPSTNQRHDNRLPLSAARRSSTANLPGSCELPGRCISPHNPPPANATTTVFPSLLRIVRQPSTFQEARSFLEGVFPPITPPPPPAPATPQSHNSRLSRQNLARAGRVGEHSARAAMSHRRTPQSPKCNHSAC